MLLFSSKENEEESNGETDEEKTDKEIEMATKTANRFKGKVRDAYLELIHEFPLVAIRSEGDLEASQGVMDQLLAKGPLSSGEEMYLDALSDLVASYEDQHYPIEPASDAEMLRHFMEAKNVSQADLHRGTGIAKSTISEILAGGKSFSRKNIRTLADFFGVEASVFASNI